jgi:hypothetical protein
VQIQMARIHVDRMLRIPEADPVVRHACLRWFG